MKIALVYNRDHIIHHIKERGYAEAPVRVDSILSELDATPLFDTLSFRKYPQKHITAVHSADFVRFFRTVALSLDEDSTLYPDVFPIRREVKKPKKLVSRAGYYCIDVYSPINRNAYFAARAAVDCALTAADELLEGRRMSYALVRPPGHHAERSSFGGYCYFNSTAIAAQYLSRYGKVAILDIDFHHGNGQEDIFYERPDVLTVSLHGDPDFEYPHFTGFRDERGNGPGLGFNINYPLPPGTEGPEYRDALKKALARIRSFAPAFLVVALGLDTAKGDPTGSFSLQEGDFRLNGELIGKLDLPSLIVQEGGYDNRVLGANARSFFTGYWEAMFGVSL